MHYRMPTLGPFQASVDLEGLKKLQTMLQKYQGILEMMQPEK